MGFFSSLTADTKESIANVHAGGSPTVYMLQPNGAAPIAEPEYDGYGVWGGVDQYEWLADMNAPSLGLDLSRMDFEAKRDIGLSLVYGAVMYMPARDEYFSIWRDYRPVLATLGIECTFIDENYAALFEDTRQTINDLISSGDMVSKPISSLVNAPYALKFSFNPDAVYEDLPPSLDCPHQGYFFPDEDEDNDDYSPNF